SGLRTWMHAWYRPPLPKASPEPAKVTITGGWPGAFMSAERTRSRAAQAVIRMLPVAITATADYALCCMVAGLGWRSPSAMAERAAGAMMAAADAMSQAGLGSSLAALPMCARGKTGLGGGLCAWSRRNAELGKGAGQVATGPTHPKTARAGRRL